MQSLSSLLKSVVKPKALAHWTRPGVDFLTEALYYEDAMGLRGYGVPRDEYEPEAELAFALAFGCKATEELWDISPRAAEDFSDEALMDCLRRSFKTLFDRDVRIRDARVQDFREALHLCTASSTKEHAEVRSALTGGDYEDDASPKGSSA
jgi:hypothetical protein